MLSSVTMAMSSPEVGAHRLQHLSQSIVSALRKPHWGKRARCQQEETNKPTREPQPFLVSHLVPPGGQCKFHSVRSWEGGRGGGGQEASLGADSDHSTPAWSVLWPEGHYASEEFYLKLRAKAV